MNIIVYLFSFLIASFSPDIKRNHVCGYNLSNPDALFILPDTLHEISGLISVDSAHFACIQDENGILFIYNAVDNKIVNQYTFNIDGDYEGIARVGKTVYVLRSDGTLFEIPDYTTSNNHIAHTTGIPANNNEGLCYDEHNNRLLIAAKGKTGKGPEFKNKRVIYGFDLDSKKLSKNPVIEFDLSKIKKAALHLEPEIPVRFKKKSKIADPVIRFRTSAIGIHPITGKLYLLSASDYLLFIFNLQGEILHVEKLNPELFNKAEGITFFENGDMLITNEGQKGKPTLLRFYYR